MSKKTIVLADNSYTIRRIVELSFSEEEAIELVSFEDGANLKKRLLELKPEIVMVDIKLPDFSGYEVCKFINTTESLQLTKVFLLKGGFEPIDESLLTNLKYASIITKPFDSNALVATIKKIFSSPAKAAPGTIPAETPAFAPGDIPEVEGLSEPESEISFSDVKEEVGTEGILSDGASPRIDQYMPTDDVLPSEEITQGTQPEVDTLAPSKEDEMANPFEEEAPGAIATRKTLSEEELDIKMNIQAQERELDIESLTQEEIKIKQHLNVGGPPFTGDQPGATGKPGADMPGQFEDQQLDIPAAGTMYEGNEKEKRTEAAEPPLQIDDLLDQQKAEVPEAAETDKYPEIEKALGLEEINFEKEIKSEPEPVDSVPATEEKSGFPDFEPGQEIQKTPVQEDPLLVEEDILEGTGSAAGIEFEIPGMEKPSLSENQGIKEEPDEREPVQEEMFTLQPREDQDFSPVEESPPTDEERLETPAIKKEELLYKVEDKLTIAIKEILWDVVPPMAEKIIKSEIEKLKAEVDKSFEYIEK